MCFKSLSPCYDCGRRHICRTALQVCRINNRINKKRLKPLLTDKMLSAFITTSNSIARSPAPPNLFTPA